MSSAQAVQSKYSPAPCATISISGLPSSLTSTEVLGSPQWFGQFGDIETVCIDQNGSVHVRYADAKGAIRAVQKMHLYQVPATNDILEVSLLIMNNEEIQQDPFQQTLHDIERRMFEEEIFSLKEYIQSMHAVNEEKQTRIQRQNDKIKELQEDNDRIRVKHCLLIRDFNILDQKYSKMSDYEQKVKHVVATRDALQHKCLWLKQQMQNLMQSNLELQNLVFRNSPAMIHEAEQVEGMIEGSA